MMSTRKKKRSRFVVMVATLAAAVVGAGCAGAGAFQPLTYGAKPWNPPAGWDPEPTSGGLPGYCPVGYYVAIDSCTGCTAISYALCDGASFTQCVCGGPFWSGATCPGNLSCGPNDFPPTNWTEYGDYAGPGWAGLEDAGNSG